MCLIVKLWGASRSQRRGWMLTLIVVVGVEGIHQREKKGHETTNKQVETVQGSLGVGSMTMVALDRIRTITL